LTGLAGRQEKGLFWTKLTKFQQLDRIYKISRINRRGILDKINKTEAERR
jgi:hypothetical protein